MGLSIFVLRGWRGVLRGSLEFVGFLERAIWSLRLRLRSCLRQRGGVFDAAVYGTETKAEALGYQPCPFESPARTAIELPWWLGAARTRRGLRVVGNYFPAAAKARTDGAPVRGADWAHGVVCG
jgi:hypothetical protein